MAIVAQMNRDLAGRWLTEREFADCFAAIKSMPGPVAFQMVTYLAYRRVFEQTSRRMSATLAAGLAAVCFVGPAMILMLSIAMTYSAWSSWHWTKPTLIGIQAAALGLILSSLVPLSKAAKSQGDHQEAAKWMFALFGFFVTLFKPELESIAILICGTLALAPFRTRLLSSVALPAALVGVSSASIHSDLFLICLKSGALVFGSGLAIVPLLGGEFVDRLQWLSHTEFLEAISFGQMTPGPILITATYIGAKVAGISGGLIATIGIFLVPFIHMTTWFPRVLDKLSKSQQWQRFSFGAISAVIGAVMASVIKLLEPVVLAALEIEGLHLNKSLLTLLIWFALPPIAFYLIDKKKRPAWAVLALGGAVSYGVLGWL